MNTPSGPLIGLIGVGTMGSRMGRRLAERDVMLIPYDSAPDAAARLAGHPSVTIAGHVTELAGCDAVITMLPDGDAVRSALLGGPSPLAGLLAPGSVVIDMSSSAPGDSVALAGTLAQRDIGFIDAPVSGGAQRAQDGTLAIMAGGDEQLIARWTWMFEILGRGCVHCGPVGSGHALKALNNLLSAGGLLLAVEALAVGKRFGLSPPVMLEVINQSSGANNSTQNKLAQRVLSRSFDAGFTIGLMTKDLMTARDLAREVGVDVPLSARTVELWSEALAALGPGADHTAIAKWFEDNHGLTLDDLHHPEVHRRMPPSVRTVPADERPAVQRSERSVERHKLHVTAAVEREVAAAPLAGRYPAQQPAGQHLVRRPGQPDPRARVRGHDQAGAVIARGAVPAPAVPLPGLVPRPFQRDQPRGLRGRRGADRHHRGERHDNGDRGDGRQDASGRGNRPT